MPISTSQNSSKIAQKLRLPLYTELPQAQRTSVSIVSCHNCRATPKGSIPCRRQKAASLPYACNRLWCMAQSGTVNSSLTLIAKPRG